MLALLTQHMAIRTLLGIVAVTLSTACPLTHLSSLTHSVLMLTDHLSIGQHCAWHVQLFIQHYSYAVSCLTHPVSLRVYKTSCSSTIMLRSFIISSGCSLLYKSLTLLVVTRCTICLCRTGPWTSHWTVCCHTRYTRVAAPLSCILPRIPLNILVRLWAPSAITIESNVLGVLSVVLNRIVPDCLWPYQSSSTRFNVK